MIELVTPAPDRNLLTIEELRAAAGVTGAAEDAALSALGLRISDLIAAECSVARAGLAVPTLRQETVRERLAPANASSLFLSRRFVEIVSVSEAGTALGDDAYDLEPLFGELTRSSDGAPRCWGRQAIVTYRAGFPSDQIPSELKEAAILALREMRSTAGRDPLLRSETIEGVGRFDYQVGGTNRSGASPLPLAAVAALDAFRTIPFA